MATPRGREKFPLWWHKGAQAWCKKLRGTFHYFGADKEQAQKRYLAEWPDILAGRVPRADASALTVAHLVNSFLTAKRDKVDAGELSGRTWGEYHHAAE